MTVKSSFISSDKIKLRIFPKNIATILLLADILGLIISSQFAVWLRLGEAVNYLNPFSYIFGFLVLLTLYLADTYKPDKQIAGLRTPARLLISNLLLAVFTAAFIYIFGIWQKSPLLWRSILLPSLVLFVPWAILSRMIALSYMRSRAENTRWLVLGTLSTEGSVKKFVEDFQEKNSLGRLVILSEDSQKLNLFQDSKTDNKIQCPGTIKDLSQWINQSWNGILIGSETQLSDALQQKLMDIRLQGIPVYKLSDFYETLWYKLPSCLLKDTWFVFSSGFNLVSDRVSLRIKRFLDISFAGILLIAISPLMLLAAIAIKLDSPGPIFYSQLRSGLNGKAFRVYKFRSMYQDAEKRGAQWAKERDSRITRVGNFIRLTRIDELPQIWNVFRGEMSMIGPRPERPEFDAQLKEVIPYYEVRYLVKPGITGWAQVMYPYGASIEDAYQKLSYDIYYIKNYSFWLDLAIILKTIRVVLLGKGR
jgi:exopolysaccharide biosynthesis polyprenyl glycosylphosphotransferase